MRILVRGQRPPGPLVRPEKVYERIYALVKKIPPGKVATYGQIAGLTGRCTPRMVGYAMAALKGGQDVPWQRVINCRGMVSQRKKGSGALRQRNLLEAEGVRFDAAGRTDFGRFGWRGPHQIRKHRW